MKKNLLALLFLSFSNFLFAQVTVTPDAVQITLDVDNFADAIGHATVKNNYNYEITIKWEKGNVCNGEDWLFSICDKNSCYFPTVLEREVILAPGEESIIDMHLNEITGNYAILKTIITNLNDVTEVKEIHYYFNTVDCEGTSPVVGTTLVENKQVQLFPNPVSNQLHIINATASEVWIYDIKGQFVFIWII